MPEEFDFTAHIGEAEEQDRIDEEERRNALARRKRAVTSSPFWNYDARQDDQSGQGH